MISPSSSFSPSPSPSPFPSPSVGIPIGKSVSSLAKLPSPSVSTASTATLTSSLSMSSISSSSLTLALASHIPSASHNSSTSLSLSTSSSSSSISMIPSHSPSLSPLTASAPSSSSPSPSLAITNINQNILIPNSLNLLSPSLSASPSPSPTHSTSISTSHSLSSPSSSSSSSTLFALNALNSLSSHQKSSRTSVILSNKNKNKAKIPTETPPSAPKPKSVFSSNSLLVNPNPIGNLNINGNITRVASGSFSPSVHNHTNSTNNNNNNNINNNNGHGLGIAHATPSSHSSSQNIPSLQLTSSLSPSSSSSSYASPSPSPLSPPPFIRIFHSLSIFQHKEKDRSDNSHPSSSLSPSPSIVLLEKFDGTVNDSNRHLSELLSFEYSPQKEQNGNQNDLFSPQKFPFCDSIPFDPSWAHLVNDASSTSFSQSLSSDMSMIHINDSLSSPSPVSVSPFVITISDGSHLFGLSLTHHPSKLSFLLISPTTNTSALRLMILRIYRSLMENHCDISNENFRLFCFSIPFILIPNGPCDVDVVIQMEGIQMIIQSPSLRPLSIDMDHSPSCHSFYDGIQSVGVTNFISLILCLFSEFRILVHSHSLFRIHQFCLCLRAAIFPFEWKFPFVTNITLSIIEAIQLPTPFLFGIHTEIFKGKEGQECWKEANHNLSSSSSSSPSHFPFALVDLDEGTMEISPLNSISPLFHMREIKKFSQSLVDAKINFIKSLDNNQNDNEGGEGSQGDFLSYESCVQCSLFSFYGDLLSQYKNYLFFISNIPFFNAASFIANKMANANFNTQIQSGESVSASPAISPSSASSSSFGFPSSQSSSSSSEFAMENFYSKFCESHLMDSFIAKKIPKGKQEFSVEAIDIFSEIPFAVTQSTQHQHSVYKLVSSHVVTHIKQILQRNKTTFNGHKNEENRNQNTKLEWKIEFHKEKNDSSKGKEKEGEGEGEREPNLNDQQEQGHEHGQGQSQMKEKGKVRIQSKLHRPPMSSSLSSSPSSSSLFSLHPSILPSSQVGIFLEKLKNPHSYAAEYSFLWDKKIEETSNTSSSFSSSASLSTLSPSTPSPSPSPVPLLHSSRLTELAIILLKDTPLTLREFAEIKKIFPLSPSHRSHFIHILSQPKIQGAPNYKISPETGISLTQIIIVILDEINNNMNNNSYGVEIINGGEKDKTTAYTLTATSHSPSPVPTLSDRRLSSTSSLSSLSLSPSRDMDYSVCHGIFDLCSFFYWDHSVSVGYGIGHRKYLEQEVRGHNLWKSMEFWKYKIKFELIEQIQNQTKTSPSLPSSPFLSTSDFVFHWLLNFIPNSISMQISSSLVLRVVTECCKLYGVTAKQQNDLKSFMANITQVKDNTNPHYNGNGNGIGIGHPVLSSQKSH